MTSVSFDPTIYGETVAELLRGDGLDALGPGERRPHVRESLDRLTETQWMAPRRVVNRPLARACLAGLWLYHNFLDESHAISQSLSTAEGSFWHAVMHRREPDFSNAKYWFRQVGDHPVFPLLRDRAANIAQQEKLPTEGDVAVRFLTESPSWDPLAWVDLCQQATTDPFLESICLQIQRAEWELLFDYCYQGASEQN